MKSIATRIPVALVPVLLLAGCVDILGLEDRPPSIVERDGLSYQVIVTESRYDYSAFEYRVRITNTSSRTIERWIPADLARPRVYRDGSWRYPVWDACDWGCGGYYGDQIRVWLRRGEALEGWGGEVWAEDFARGYGTYHLAVLIDTGRHRFEVLGIPAIRVR